MASGESVTVPAADRKRPRRLGAMLRSQMRNIAPFLTLICLFGFFAAASPSFATLDNLGNILTQISVTGIIAVGLTFVILCAEIDLSVAASPTSPASRSPISRCRNPTSTSPTCRCPDGPRSCWRWRCAPCSASSTRSG